MWNQNNWLPEFRNHNFSLIHLPQKQPQIILHLLAAPINRGPNRLKQLASNSSSTRLTLSQKTTRVDSARNFNKHESNRILLDWLSSQVARQFFLIYIFVGIYFIQYKKFLKILRNKVRITKPNYYLPHGLHLHDHIS